MSSRRPWGRTTGRRRRSIPEVVGQIIRIALKALGSVIGIVPVGNTGGTNIVMFKRLPVDPAIRKLME
ncbi:DUF3703 domain-containing protein [Telluria aromaticivorans]|uniref:DUF3703 domain-containing protein n=1 Tax=Telluria aromaticivorans TaxID=2725995 RepID=A0A7Y2JUX3_9BURK|nr:DUF3703 domain-containing protein [Telluria aromaticivorans]